MQFATPPAPYRFKRGSVTRIMLLVLVMLIPAALAQVIAFGPGLIVQIVIAVGTALAAEAAMLYLKGQPQVPFLTDGSAVVAAVLLAFALPSLAPWWLAVSGTAFAIIFAKHLFGGLGHNVFNPAMAGYALLLVSFPAEMTRWPAPDDLVGDAGRLGFAFTVKTILTGALPAGTSWDAISAATPLDAVRTGLKSGYTMQEIRSGVVFGSLGGRGSEWVSLAVAAGGLGLLALKVIRWQIPCAMLASIVLFAGLLNALDPGAYPGVLFHLTTGATMLGAFFIACDPVTAATSPRGRLWFGAGVGVLTVAIRSWGQYPDGVAFAVLMMNLLAPLIDRFTVPRIYGHSR